MSNEANEASADAEMRAAIGDSVRLTFWARALRAGFWTSLINLGSAAVALLVLLEAPLLLIAPAVLVVLTALWLRSPWKNLRERHSTGMAGLWWQSRALLLVSAGAYAALAADGGGRSGPGAAGWVALALCLGSTVLEPTVRSSSDAGYAVVVNLPGTPVRPRAWFRPSLLYPANVACLLVVGTTLVAGLPGWAALAVAAASTTTTVVAFVDASLRLARRHEIEEHLPELIEGYGPVFALHWQAPAGTAYQAAMWLPYLERLGKPFMVIVRTETNLRDIIQLTDAPIVLRKGLEDLDAVVASTLKTVFYVNTAVRNSHMVRYSHMTHVQLNHGDSDKAPSYNPVFRMYDHDFVAGQAAIDRFAANGVFMPREMFTIVGRPQVENVQIAQRPIGEIENPTVLYAPTWSGFYADSDYSSLRVGVEMVEQLLERGCTVIFRPHPYARRTRQFAEACTRIITLLEEHRAATGRPHLAGEVAESEMTVFDCFNACDALISDVSSVVADFLYSEKPFAMVAVSQPAEGFAEHFPIAEAAYVVDGYGGTLDGFGEVLGEMLGEDPLRPTRQKLKTYYLGDIPAESYAQRFLDEARALL